MRLHLMRANSIADLQAGFNASFPNLKLEFYRVPHKEETLSREESRYADNTVTLGEIAKLPEAGMHIDFDPADSVWSLEKKFADQALLYVQVFRKGAGDVWLATSATDDWSLEKQNRKGAESAADIQEIEGETDYREQP
jgi:hypothetical protein